MFSSLLFSEEERIPYLTSECDALALVEGVVNAYNGKLVQIDQDIEIRGSDPLDMTRFYDGGHHFDSEFGYGVGCGYPALLRTFGIKNKYYAAVELRQGLEVLCELKKDKKKLIGGIAKNYYQSGYTNSCKALLLGEPALSAMRVELSETEATVSLGDGTKRHYYRFTDLGYGVYYRLAYEERPNGNHRYFSYTYNTFPFSLKRIWTTNRDGSVTLNWLEFLQRKDEFLVKASNGQEAHLVKVYHPIFTIPRRLSLIGTIQQKIPERDYFSMRHGSINYDFEKDKLKL